MKYFLLLFLVAILGKGIVLQALPVNNPESPQVIEKGIWIGREAAWGVKAGYEQSWVHDRRLGVTSPQRHSVEKVKIFTTQGVITFNGMDRLEVYGSMGNFQATVRQRGTDFPRRRSFKTKKDLTYGLGGRFLLAQWGALVLGIEGKIQGAHPQVKSTGAQNFQAGATGRLKYCEWQIASGVAYRIGEFSPYFALKYSNVHARLAPVPPPLYPRSRMRMRNRDRFGGAFGLTLSKRRVLDLFTEMRAFDERAFSVGGNIRF